MLDLLRPRIIGQYRFEDWRSLLSWSRKRYENAANAVLILVAIAVFLMPQLDAETRLQEVRRVLILNIFEPLVSPGVALIDQAIVAGLEKSPYQIELYSENLEAGLFADAASQQHLREWYIRKYRNRKFDVIIAVGPEPLRFLMESHETSFQGIPVVFCGSTTEMLDELKLDTHFTGVWGVAQPEKTIDAALRLRPSTKHLVVVGGVGVYDRKLESLVRRSLQSLTSRLDFTFLTDLDMPTLLDRLKHLPGDTIVYHTAITQDAAGSSFIDATQAVPMVAKAANAPVFVMDDVDIGRGTVGGYVLSLAAEGQIAAAMATRVLNGEKPENIPIVNSANVYMFDWRALQRWGLKEHNLPPGSVILHRRPTTWESYKRPIVGSSTLVLLEATLILGLLWQRAQRRRVETELAVTNDSLRLAVEAGKSVGWDWDLKSGRSRRFGDLRTIFGIPTDTYSGVFEDLLSWIDPDDRDVVLKAIADARENRTPYSAEFRVIRRDRTVRWLAAKGKFYYGEHSDAIRMRGIAVDITDRKLAEQALSSLTGRLIEVQEEERRRIARDIHDDYNQRLAVIAIDLQELAANIGQLNGDGPGHLRKLWNSVSELSADLHALSHRLHSSTLENLGLVPGIIAFCDEFTAQQGIHIKFIHENVPPRIPGDLALCLFRIVQESLRNIKKHSGTAEAEIRLEGVDENLHLSVSDQGKGFDANARSSTDGIGLRSMQERLRLLGGRLQIFSRPTKGTRVEAWLPMNSPVSV